MVNYLAHLKIIFGRLGYSLESQNVMVYVVKFHT